MSFKLDTECVAAKVKKFQVSYYTNVIRDVFLTNENSISKLFRSSPWQLPVGIGKSTTD